MKNELWFWTLFHSNCLILIHFVYHLNLPPVYALFFSRFSLPVSSWFISSSLTFSLSSFESLFHRIIIQAMITYIYNIYLNTSILFDPVAITKHLKKEINTLTSEKENEQKAYCQFIEWFLIDAPGSFQPFKSPMGITCDRSLRMARHFPFTCGLVVFIIMHVRSLH